MLKVVQVRSFKAVDEFIRHVYYILVSFNHKPQWRPFVWWPIIDIRIQMSITQIKVLYGFMSSRSFYITLKK